MGLRNWTPSSREFRHSRTGAYSRVSSAIAQEHLTKESMSVRSLLFITACAYLVGLVAAAMSTTDCSANQYCYDAYGPNNYCYTCTDSSYPCNDNNSLDDDCSPCQSLLTTPSSPSTPTPGVRPSHSVQPGLRLRPVRPLRLRPAHPLRLRPERPRSDSVQSVHSDSVQLSNHDSVQSVHSDSVLTAAVSTKSATPSLSANTCPDGTQCQTLCGQGHSVSLSGSTYTAHGERVKFAGDCECYTLSGTVQSSQISGSISGFGAVTVSETVAGSTYSETFKRYRARGIYYEPVFWHQFTHAVTVNRSPHFYPDLAPSLPWATWYRSPEPG